MNDDQALHALYFDDAYEVRSVLAKSPNGTTELVFLGDAGPFVRKKIPKEMARRDVWSALSECSCLRLPHVIATYELPDLFVVVCDYIPGDSLENLVSQRGTLAVDEAISITLNVCEATEAIHARNIIHRDLSPANIIIAADGAHIIDFNIARLYTAGETKDTNKLGTFGFASPEQFGFAPTDARSDVYSIGRLLGFMLTGIRPDDDSYETSLNAVLNTLPNLQTVLKRACAFEPSSRFQSAQALSSALEEIVGNRSSSEALAKTGADQTSNTNQSTLSKLKSNLRKPAFLIPAIIVVILLVAGIAWVATSLTPTASNDNTNATTAQSSSSNNSTQASSSSNTSVNNKSATSTDDVKLVVSESNVYQSTDGYVGFAVALRNESKTTAVKYPSVTVTGKNADGTIMFSSNLLYVAIGPGETKYSASITQGDSLPASIECSVDKIDSYNLSTSLNTGAFTVSNVSIAKAGGTTKLTGEVKVDDAGNAGNGYVEIVAVFRDENGKIVYAQEMGSECPQTGQSTSFDMPIRSNLDYASLDVYARV